MSAAKVKRTTIGIVASMLLLFSIIIYFGCKKVDLKPSSASQTAAKLFHPTVTRNSGTITKWHPGHYVFLGSVDINSYHYNKLWTDTLIRKNFIGIQVKILWPTIETSYNTYDWTLIDAIRKYIDSMNTVYASVPGFIPKRLVIQCPDRVFASPTFPGPAYMQWGFSNANDTLYQGGYFEENSGAWALKDWIPAVNDRWKRLVQKIGNRYDTDTLLEAIVFSETVMQNGVSGSFSWGSYSGTPSQNGYNDTAYMNLLKSNLTNFTGYYPSTVMIQYLNRFTNDTDTAPNDSSYFMTSMGNYCDSNYIGIGGPDIQPPTNLLPDHSDAYFLFTSHRGKMPFAISGQGPDYSRTGGGGTGPGSKPQDLFQFSVGPPDTLTTSTLFYPDIPLKVNYVFWSTSTSTSPTKFSTSGAQTDPNDTTTIVRYVNYSHARINTVKP